MNGQRLDESDDYTYNSSNYTLTFTEPFDGGEKITVIISYFDDSATDIALFATSDKYEKPYEKTKVFSTFTNTSITLDTDNFNLFVIDMTTNSSNTLSISIPNMAGSAIGKSIMISMLFNTTVPTITWSNNIIWNTATNTAPTFETNKSYNISMFQVNNTVKYIANVNSEFSTSALVLNS